MWERWNTIEIEKLFSFQNMDLYILAAVTLNIKEREKTLWLNLSQH